MPIHSLTGVLQVHPIKYHSDKSLLKKLHLISQSHFNQSSSFQWMASLRHLNLLLKRSFYRYAAKKLFSGHTQNEVSFGACTTHYKAVLRLSASFSRVFFWWRNGYGFTSVTFTQGYLTFEMQKKTQHLACFLSSRHSVIFPKSTLSSWRWETRGAAWG